MHQFYFAILESTLIHNSTSSSTIIFPNAYDTKDQARHKNGLRGRTQITLAVEGGGGFVKCLCYYISLCSKLANKGGRGDQKSPKSC